MGGPFSNFDPSTLAMMMQQLGIDPRSLVGPSPSISGTEDAQPPVPPSPGFGQQSSPAPVPGPPMGPAGPPQPQQTPNMAFGMVPPATAQGGPNGGGTPPFIGGQSGPPQQGQQGGGIAGILKDPNFVNSLLALITSKAGGRYGGVAAQAQLNSGAQRQNRQDQLDQIAYMRKQDQQAQADRAQTRADQQATIARQDSQQQNAIVGQVFQEIKDAEGMDDESVGAFASARGVTDPVRIANLQKAYRTFKEKEPSGTVRIDTKTGQVVPLTAESANSPNVIEVPTKEATRTITGIKKESFDRKVQMSGQVLQAVAAGTMTPEVGGKQLEALGVFPSGALLQKKADPQGPLDREQADLEEIPKGKRTPEQTSRLDAIKKTRTTVPAYNFGNQNPAPDLSEVKYWTKLVTNDAKNMGLIKNRTLYDAVSKELSANGVSISHIDAQTRDAAKFAKSALTHIPTIEKEIAGLEKSGKLGPAMSRWGDFMAGTYGAGDPEFNALRTNIGLMDTAMGRVHGGARGGGSQVMLQHFKGMLSAKVMDPATLRSSLGVFKDWLGTYADMDTSFGGEASSDSTSGPTPTRRWNPDTKKLESIGGQD